MDSTSLTRLYQMMQAGSGGGVPAGQQKLNDALRMLLRNYMKQMASGPQGVGRKDTFGTPEVGLDDETWMSDPYEQWNDEFDTHATGYRKGPAPMRPTSLEDYAKFDRETQWEIDKLNEARSKYMKYGYGPRKGTQ